MITTSQLGDLDLPGDDLRLDRALLRDQAAETLRDYIASGRIPEGTKITERAVSELLGISRMPAREALMILQAQGLLVARTTGRYVITLTEKDVRDLHALRWTLERLAASLAAEHCNEAHRAALVERLAALQEAIASGDPSQRTKADLALHQAIWRQADNPHLLRVLDAVLGAIFVLADRAELYSGRDAQILLRGHAALVERISAGDGIAAGEIIERQVRSALEQSLRTFREPRRDASVEAGLTAPPSGERFR